MKVIISIDGILWEVPSRVEQLAHYFYREGKLGEFVSMFKKSIKHKTISAKLYSGNQLPTTVITKSSSELF